MNITLNGEDRSFPQNTLPLPELLELLKLGGQPVIVELNGNALLGRELPSIKIKDSDQIEIVRIVAGG
ncbi:MAG: sulfur carrier protein ThiS [Verrucomicrobiales bacterium]|nr:sulfur carrier protein ThiS [Verrucomicrobiales bacterium]